MNITRRLKKRKKVNRYRSAHLHKTYIDKAIADEEFSVRDGEGHLRKSIEISQLRWLGLVFVVLIILLIYRIGYLQIVKGEQYIYISENNTFDHVAVLPIRGTIYDRNEKPIAWNTKDMNDEMPERTYHGEGLSSLLGFTRYPQKDKDGNYYRQETKGEGGLEQKYNFLLAGGSGSIVLEKDAVGNIVSELYIEKPTDGDDVVVSMDIDIQRTLYEALKKTAEEMSFQSGSGVILNAINGEIIALVSYPDFDNNALVDQSKKISEQYLREQDEGIFVNKAISGLYGPGSTVKPFFAIAALEEEIVSPYSIITSKGSISIQNPYYPDIVYVYKDWRAHGDLTIYDAIAWSSNVYFYHIGGGYAHVNGLGIDRLNFYAEMFGFGRPTEIEIFHEPPGLVPSPEWKKNRYGEKWNIGDTYNTVIGQYAFQATPLQLARATAAIANGGIMLEPHFEKGIIPKKVKLAISDTNLKIVQEGMRKTVTHGTAKTLNISQYDVAAKTGTAQIGRGDIVNSLLTGFFPYKEPKYVFVIVMERGIQEGAAITAGQRFFAELAVIAPKYL